MLVNIISTLVQGIIKLVIVLAEFMVIIVLGIVAAFLFIMPWLLRAAAIVLWLIASYMVITSIHWIYAPFSQDIPLIALKFFAILLAVSWMGSLLLTNSKYFWGGLYAGALVMSGMALGAEWLIAGWKYAGLFFRVLPPALFSVLLVYETIKMRSRRRGETGRPAQTGLLPQLSSRFGMLLSPLFKRIEDGLHLSDPSALSAEATDGGSG